MAGDELRLATVRIARGLTQSELAKRSGISQATISKVESGLVELDESRWGLLARELDAPVSVLSAPVGPDSARAVVFHRKRSSLPVSAATRLRARLDLTHLQVAGLLADGPPVQVPRIPLPPDGYVTPEEVAQQVRLALGLAGGPVSNLIQVLEEAGVAVVRDDLGSVKIDALMSWPPTTVRPVVLLGNHAPGDRQRFSVAHELGHVVMHEMPSDAQESEADRFAAELLMPRADIIGHLREVSLASLARLKQVWGVSMAALLRRARDLAQISDSTYRRLSIELSSAGYRTREPVDVPVEVPGLLDAQVAAMLRAGRSSAELATAASMTEHDFVRTYLQESA